MQAVSGLSRGRPLTSYFAVLVVLMVIVAAATVAYVYVRTDRDSRHDAEQDTRYSADAAARDIGDGVALVKLTVGNLAKTPNIEAGAAQESCTLTFGLEGDLYRGHIDIIRPDGTIACSSQPKSVTAGHGYGNAGWFRRATSAPAFVAPATDLITGDSSVISAAPTPQHWVVAAFVALAPVGQGLARLYGGGHPVEVLITNAGETRVLTRSIAPGQSVGKPLAGTAFAKNAGSSDGRDLDGTARFYEQTVVPGTGWHLFVGEDKSSALSAGQQLRKRQLGIIGGGLALVLLAMLVVYRRVAVPIRRLGASVRATTERLPPEPVQASGPKEIATLGDDVNALIEAVGREVEGRRRAEDTVAESERSYRALFEHSPLPMWIHDADTEAMLAVNDAAVSRYGYTREEFLELTMADLVSAERTRDNESDAVTHQAKDGDEIKVRTITHDVAFEGRRARCVVAEDVGARERLESQLRQAQKMEAIGHLAGGVAHDFNNLLTVISGYGAMARERIGAGPGGRELTEIERAAERAAQLTHQLLAFSRQQVVNPVVLDLNEVIAAVTPMLARLIGENIEIGVLGADDVPKVFADRSQIEQTIVNLAVNARDAMPDGGTLSIEAQRAQLDDRYAASHAGITPGAYACIAVSDTGVGIDRETQTHIFEPFFTTKEVGRGTGLGLATVHGTVNQSGGHIEVYSELGLGTTFKVYLPAAVVDTETATAAPVDRPETLGGTETILLCEDDDLVRQLIETILTTQGYTVLPAARPEEAMELAATHGNRIDVLVSDVVMPGMSGPELIEQLTKAHPSLRAVLLSGYTAETIRGRGIPAGSAFLQKPFSDVDLLQTIRGLLERTSAATAKAPDVSEEPAV
jgi:PAS domain S-box-containing protein